MQRGVQRNSKRAPHKARKPEAPFDGDRLEWAIAEIESTGAYIRQGNDYLEAQFKLALQEDGNSVEVLRLQKAFEARQDRALSVRKEMEGGVRLAAHQEGGAGRGGFDLSSPVVPD